MIRSTKFLVILGALLIAAFDPVSAAAQETRAMKPGAQPPPARVEDLAWLQGQWEGPGLTGPAAEVYSGPAGGQIVGHFRQQRDNGIWFYELMTIVQVGASLEYRLKHFNHDLTGWEEKGTVLKFPLVAVEKDAWYFDGLTVRRDGPDGMIGAVRIDSKDGPPREAVFKYRRVK
jgi:hypothetical protein